MPKKFLEITQENTKRFFGSYTVSGEVAIIVVKWHIKEGDLISEGPLVTIEAEKGESEIEALDEEIGSRVSKIFVPADTEREIEINLEEPFRLAELETND